MLIEWTTLTGDQRKALLHMATGRSTAISQEICEQLRNLGLAERMGTSVVLSTLGRCMLPVAANA